LHFNLLAQATYENMMAGRKRKANDLEDGESKASFLCMLWEKSWWVI
jgi:hypothetical protein